MFMIVSVSPDYTSIIDLMAAPTWVKTLGVPVCSHQNCLEMNELDVQTQKLDDGWPESAEELVTLVLLEEVHKQSVL